MAEERKPRVEHIPDRGSPDLPPSRDQIDKVASAARERDLGTEAIRYLAIDSSSCLRDLKGADETICRELLAHGDRIVRLETALLPLTSASATMTALRSAVAWAVGTVGTMIPIYLGLKALGWL